MACTPPCSQAVDMLIYKGREELEVRNHWHTSVLSSHGRPCYKHRCVTS